MAVLEHARHEAFAQLLARGVKQKLAYVKAGYQDNPGAASRLATMQVVKDRVLEIKTEIRVKAENTSLVPVDEHNIEAIEEQYETLAELGLNLMWVASAYKEIYEEAMESGKLPAAVSAVENIKKMIDAETQADSKEDLGTKEMISVDNALKMLASMKELVEAHNNSNIDFSMVDVTPHDPDKMLQYFEDDKS